MARKKGTELKRGQKLWRRTRREDRGFVGCLGGKVETLKDGKEERQRAKRKVEIGGEGMEEGERVRRIAKEGG